jgi:DNA-binding transcriptional MerR regulator
MSGDGLLIGEVAKRTGVTWKALRVRGGGHPHRPRRTTSGYRIYGPDMLDLLAFVRQAQRLGFSLEEIGEIVSIQRSGRLSCHHVPGLRSDGWPLSGVLRLSSLLLARLRVGPLDLSCVFLRLPRRSRTPVDLRIHERKHAGRGRAILPDRICPTAASRPKARRMPTICVAVSSLL